MPDYVATVDDSGGIEPLVKWGGQFVPGDHPIACVTTLLLRADLVDEFNEKWIDLRHEIKSHLGCGYLPPIHMRLMYGRQKPAKYRGQPNPYLNCEFEKVAEWVAKAIKIIESFRGTPRALTWNVWFETRKQMAGGVLLYFTDPHLVSELNFLAAHGKRTGSRSFAQKYLKKMASPLLPLLTKHIIQLDETMRQLRNKTVLLQVDPFADASGLDAAEILEAVNMVSKLTHIAEIEVMKDSDDVQLAQAVDLIGFVVFRTVMAANRFMKPDDVLLGIMDKHHSSQKFISADTKHIVQRRLERNKGLGISIHYAVARSAVEKVDPVFANKHMLTVAEFHEKVSKPSSGARRGYSILKDETVLALKNGEDPS